LKVLSRFPVIYITLLVIIGIIVYPYTQIDFKLLIVLFVFSVLLLILSHLHQNKQVKKNVFVPLLIALNSLVLGQLLAYQSNDTHFANHYSYHINEENFLQVKIVKILKSSSYYQNYIGKVNYLNNKTLSGKVLIKLPENEQALRLNDLINIKFYHSQLQEITDKLNPFGFDYKQFMAKKNIFHQINLKNTAYEFQKDYGFSLLQFANNIRNRIKQSFNKNLDTEAYNLAIALLLGERQNLSPDIYKSFQATGTVHILAISGLHIGILLLFLNFIFKPLKLKQPRLFLVLTISILWFYALLTGFSPSVLRAVIMFSFLQIGLQIKGDTNIYNSLFMAALLMLLINPNYIYEVGFQMSFLAVLSIVSFFPVFSRLTPVKSKIFKWFTDLFWVSVSAQLGVLSISLFYFHQFPVYFFIANMFVVPLLFLTLFFGFILMIFSLLHIEFQVFYKVFNMLLELMLRLNNTIAGWEQSLIKNIHFPWQYLILGLIGLVVFYFVLHKPKYKTPWVVLLLWILLFQLSVLYLKYQKQNSQVFYVFHQYKTAVSARALGNNLVIFQDSTLVNPYLRKSLAVNFKQIIYKKPVFYQHFKTHKILHIDSLGIYQFDKINPDIVVLHHSPKINLDKLITHLHPATIIVDGSNYPSYIKRWQKSAEKYGVDFYNINIKGAFLLQ